MAETNPATNTSTQQTDPDTQGQNGGSSQTDEKKYSDNEMNDIVKKKSEKAVSKFMNELGITDKEKAKEILRKAADDEAKNQAQTGNADDSEFKTQLATAQHETELALLENVFLTSNVQPAKVEKAVKLVDLEKCKDEDGKFSREKAKSEIDALLKEWPELAVKTDNSNVGFQIGSDGQTNTNSGNTANKKDPPVKQKGWNRWN